MNLLRYPLVVDKAFCNAQSQLKLSELLNILLYAAGKHAYELKLGVNDLNRANHTWVLSRMGVEVESCPKAGESLVIETWPKGFDRLFAIRDFVVSGAGGQSLIRAATYWLVIDLNTRRPLDMSGRMADSLYKERSAFEKKLEKLPDFEEVLYQGVQEVLPSDIDMNNHVTSVRYTEWIQSFLPPGILQNRTVRSYEVNHISEVFLGEKIRVEIGKTGPDSYISRVLHHDTGKVAFRSTMILA